MALVALAVPVLLDLYLCMQVYSSAQGGCSPVPLKTLISGGPSGNMRNNNVPNTAHGITLHMCTVYRKLTVHSPCVYVHTQTLNT